MPIMRVTLASENGLWHQQMFKFFAPGQRAKLNISQILRTLEIDAAAGVTIEFELIEESPDL